MGDAALNALQYACVVGIVHEFDRFLGIVPDSLQRLRYARANDNNALRKACAGGHLAVVESLLGLGLTAGDARASDNEALRKACAGGHLAVVERLLEFGLTVDDARANDNCALRKACAGGHLAVVERLLELGLGADDLRAVNNEALRNACAFDHRAVVCALAAAGVITPAGELHVRTLRQIIRRPATPSDEDASVDADEAFAADAATRRADTRRAAALAAARWPGHEVALARVAERDPGAPKVFDALRVGSPSRVIYSSV